jgi:hypothetical protein
LRRGSLILALLLVLAALSGCLGMGGDDAGSEAGTASTDDPFADANETNETNETEPDETGPSLNRTVINGSIEAGNVPQAGWYCVPNGPCDNDFNLEVTNATTAVLVEMTWNASADMYLGITPPFEYCEPDTPVGLLYSCPGPDPATGGAPLVIDVSNPQTLEMTGTWDGDVWVEEEVPTTVDYTLYITIAEDGDLPRQYSNVR